MSQSSIADHQKLSHWDTGPGFGGAAGERFRRGNRIAWPPGARRRSLLRATLMASATPRSNSASKSCMPRGGSPPAPLQPQRDIDEGRVRQVELMLDGLQFRPTPADRLLANPAHELCVDDECVEEMIEEQLVHTRPQEDIGV